MHRSAPTDRIYIFLFLVLSLLPSRLFAFPADDEPVRVRLMRDISPRTIIVSSTTAATLYTSGDLTNPIGQLDAGTKLTLTTSNNQVFLRSSQGGIYARSLVIDQQPEAEMTIEIAEARTMISPRRYKGAFMIQVDPSTPSTLSILNEVPLNHYIEGVLASEMDTNELEALKALSLCVRTLTYRVLENQHGPEFSLPDTEDWQVYKGTAPVTATVREAVAQTEGEVLRFDGELAEAVYFASSGGHTANNEDVWDASKIQPYLRGKDDPYDFNSPDHTWETTLSRDRLLNILSDKYKFKVNGFRILNRSRDGRVKTMAVTGENDREETISGIDFRMLVTENFGRETLKSTLFEVNVQPTMYIFSGRGFGHGVGLNQWGATQLSIKGNLYDEILRYYYTDIEIDRGGFVDRLITSTGNLIDGAVNSFRGNNSTATTNIPRASTPQPGATNDMAARVMGNEGQPPAGEQQAQAAQAGAQQAEDSKKSTQFRTPRKRIGW